MKHGDFTELSKYYINRPGYSLDVLDIIATSIKKRSGRKELIVADIGAGTGKLTEDLYALGYSGFAVEPNDAMRTEGEKALNGKPFTWLCGSAEETTLPDNSVDWLLMGSSFHWANAELALREFYRVLKPSGFFTAIWNPRDISRSTLHMEIEEKINEMIPDLKRISSGVGHNAVETEKKLLASSLFSNLFFVEAPYDVYMTKDRYIGVWKSVNDIRVQAGEECFERILKMIESKIESIHEVVVPYKSRAWTVMRIEPASAVCREK
jgi:ubiquinone/menaquinone biosynthesis C-methylase UbiE